MPARARPTGRRACTPRCGARGERHGRKRIARLLRAAGLVGASHRRGGPVTTRRGREARPAPDLVDRDFGATGPDRLWVADITFIPTAAGFLYLAVVLDAWSRKAVGWSMANHLRTGLVLDALEMAVGQRRPRDVIQHSDQGSQYTSLAFGARCREAGVRPSMGSVGDAYDNALCESFFATLECELLARRRFASQTEARVAVFGAWRSSATSRDGTTRCGSIPPWASARPSPTRRSRRKSSTRNPNQPSPQPSIKAGQSQFGRIALRRDPRCCGCSRNSICPQ
jgi:transposase InsO family protein